MIDRSADGRKDGGRSGIINNLYDKTEDVMEDGGRNGVTLCFKNVISYPVKVKGSVRLTV